MEKQAILKLRQQILLSYLREYPHALFDSVMWQSWANDYVSSLSEEGYTLASLEQQLKTLFVSHDPRMPSQKLADFYVDPLFVYHHQSDQQLDQSFQNQFSEAVHSFAKDIYQHSSAYFKDLTASELSEQTEAYKKITQFFNALNLYVQQDILRGSDVNKQCFLIQFWLDLVEKVLLLGDISSAMSIMAALNSTAIRKLSKAHQGLSVDQHARLDSLSASLSLETLRYQQDELLKKYERPVPYLGIYRTRYDVEKTKKNQSALNNIISTIQQLQEQISIDEPLSLPTLPFSLDEAVAERYAICSEQLEKIAKQSDQNSKACHQTLSQIQSGRLRDFFILKRWDPNPEEYSSWVGKLNQSVMKKQSKDDIKRLLEEAQIDCSEPDLQSFILETRQAYYYSLIRNKCLEAALGKRIIYRKNRGDSTTELLKRLDQALYNNQSAADKKINLISHLSNLNLSLNDHQLDEVVSEAQEYRQSHNLEQIEQALDEFNNLSQSVINTDLFKQQFDAYQRLLRNYYELDLDELNELRLEWGSVISGSHFGTPAYNPFLKQLDRLIELRDFLSDHQSRNSIPALCSSVSSFIQTRQAIQDWLSANQQNAVENNSVMPSRLGIWQLIRAFFRRFYGAGRILHQARLRSKNYLLKISINHINQLINNELNPLDEARKKLIQETMPLSEESLAQVSRTNKDQLVCLAPKWASFYDQARQTCEKISNDFLLAKAIERELCIDEQFTKKHQQMMNKSGLSQRFVFFRHWTQSVTSYGGHAPKLPDDMNEDQYSLTKKYFERLATFNNFAP